MDLAIKSEILPFLTKLMDFEGNMLNERRQKDKYHMILIVWHKTKKKASS